MFIFAVSSLKLLLFVSSALIWALPSVVTEEDILGASFSKNSFDDNVALISNYLSFSAPPNDDLAEIQQSSFTQGACQYLSSEYKTKNVLIYNNQSSNFNGVNSIHRSFELQTYNQVLTYEIQVFDSGNFTRVGDDGYSNWAFCGNWALDGSSVRFDPISDLSTQDNVRGAADTPSPAKLGGGTLSSSGENSPPGRAMIKRGDYMMGPTWDAEAGRWFIAYKNGDMVESSVMWFDSITDAVFADAEVSLVNPIIGVALMVVIVGVAALFGSGFANLFQQHSRESGFTLSSALQQINVNPGQNVVLYHDQDSSWNFNNWVHIHYELRLGFDKLTQGYEMYNFDSGTFTRAGDGGYINWAIAGNWIRDPPNSNFVTFKPVNSKSKAMVQARSGAKKPLRRRRPFTPQSPSRENPQTTDGHYFVNCVSLGNTISTGIAYYKNMDPGGPNVGQLPDDYVDVPCNHGGTRAWQGQGDATFHERGTAFDWTFILQGGEGHLVVAGIAETPFEQVWIYKHTGEMLYKTENATCNSVFYAF